MILLNFPPGAMGFFLLKTAHAHWPTTFNYRAYIDGGLATNNHYVRPDLFIGNAREVADADRITLTNLLSQPSIVLCHNKNIIPSTSLDAIRTNGQIFCLTCNNPDDLIRSNFLYWFKAADTAFDYVDTNNKDMDFYQAIYQQLLIYVFQPQVEPEGIAIDFADLGDYASIQPWISAVRQEFSLGEPEPGLESWYETVFNRNQLPITAYPDYYNYFRTVWTEIQDRKISDQRNYQDVLTGPTAIKFRMLMDFFKSVYNDLHMP